MPTPFVQLIPFSDPAGLPLAATISQAIETVRRRAFELFEQRLPQEGNEFEDWLRAERELFEIPDARVLEDEGPGWLTVRFETRASADHPLTILIEPQAVTALSFNEQGELTLLRRLNLRETVDPARLSVEQSGSAVEVMLMLAEAPVAEAPAKVSAAAAGASSSHRPAGLIAVA